MVTVATRNASGEVEVKKPEPPEPAPQVPAKLVADARRAWDDFEASLRKSLDKAIALGKRLVALKEKCGHGNFGAYFSDHEKPNADALPFTSSWARRLMTIADNPAISNREYTNDLPANLDCIYELATMTAPALEAAIESGKVRPDMTRAEAKALKSGQEASRPDPQQEAAAHFSSNSDMVMRFNKFIRWLTEHLEQHPNDRAGARMMVNAMAKLVKKEEHND